MEHLISVESSMSDAAMTRLYMTLSDEVLLVLVPGKWGAQMKTGVHIPLYVTLHWISMWSAASTALPGRLTSGWHVGFDSENHNRSLISNYRKPAISLKLGKIGPRLLLMTNRTSHTHIRAFDSCQNQRPWMTLKGHYALCFNTRAYFGAHHEYLNKDRPIYQRRKP